MYDPLETVPDFKYCKWVGHKEGGGRATAQLQRWNFQGTATCEKKYFVLPKSEGLVSNNIMY